MLDKELNIALDPKRDVVVDACAGSGKTWLLASRIVRLLLSGCGRVRDTCDHIHAESCSRNEVTIDRMVTVFIRGIR